MKNEDLQSVREGINQIDKEIVLLIERRSELSKEVARIKAKECLPIYYVEREQSILTTLSKDSTLGEGLKPIFTEIISLCRKNQQVFSVGVQEKVHYPSLIAIRSIFGSVVKVSIMKKIEIGFDYLLFPLKNLDESVVDFLLKETSIKSGIIYHVKSLEEDYLLVSSHIDSNAFQDKVTIIHSNSDFKQNSTKGVFLSSHPNKMLILESPPSDISINESRTLDVYHASC